MVTNHKFMPISVLFLLLVLTFRIHLMNFGGHLIIYIFNILDILCCSQIILYYFDINICLFRLLQTFSSTSCVLCFQVLGTSKSDSSSSLRVPSSHSQSISPSAGNESKTVLDKARLRELVKEVDPLEQMDDDVEEVFHDIIISAYM